MTEQMLLRFAMILQNQAPSTLNKYICKLVEAVLLEHTNGITLFQLNQTINEQFNLTFTEEEVKTAITKKGKDRIEFSNNLYSLIPSVRQTLSSQQSLSDELDSTIGRFVSKMSLNISVEKVSSLLKRYLYYSFNSNVDNLMSLFEGKITYASKSFEASNDEINIINAFIAWEDSKKDSLVYSLIATCYEYCMLTIKKDKILSDGLFKGKRFYLDANIIFRMAGINNEERKTVTTNFVQHCQNAGIELYCTSATLDEVFRVITAQVEFIRGFAGSSKPVSSSVLKSINPSMDINDFYELYYDWCQIPRNEYGDYVSFSQYMFDLVHDTLKQLKFKESGAYKVDTKSKQFSEQAISLRNYKNDKRKWRYASTQSAETDVTNIMDVLNWRQGTGTSLWQTNDFIVSADQLLISWADSAFSGVPIVVLPSVWLSIILRFTGRSDDDYKSFCLFLTQRQHDIDKKIVDPVQLLENINKKTNQTDIKERIIIEIAQNKAKYTFETAEDYDVNTDRAFDKILEEEYGKASQQINDVRDEMRRQMEADAKSSKERIEEETKVSAAAEREKNIVAFSKKQALDKVRFFRFLNSFGWIAYLLAGIIIISGAVICIYEIEPLYSDMIILLPQKIRDVNAFMAVWSVISLGLGFVAFAIRKLIGFLGSEKREDRLYERFYEQNKKVFK